MHMFSSGTAFRAQGKRMRAISVTVLLATSVLVGGPAFAQHIGGPAKESLAISTSKAEPLMLTADASALPAAPTPVVAAPPVIATPAAQSQTAEDSHDSRNKKIWFSLSLVSHGAATFDAWSTRNAIEHGGQELNPVFKPFANSNAMYAAVQIAPLGMDYLGRRMMRSQNRTFRKMWWVPQTASALCSLAAGAHNVAVN